MLAVTLVRAGLALLVDLLRHWLKVRWVAAADEQASVVYLQALGDRARQRLVCNAVCQ